MKNFVYNRAATFEEAASLAKPEAKYMAGGTDLVGVLKDRILPDYPQEIIALSRIPGADSITTEAGMLKIGATAKLAAVAASDTVKQNAPILSEAAHSVATPLIRNTGTIGGNICQDVRCWFYRYPHEIGGRLKCLRKGGDTCYALQGDNRYHSIFGGMKTSITPCAANCPAGTDIPGYMALLRKGDVEGAAKTILNVNPMPMLTARVCAHFCQESCNRCANDENVSIGNVERYVGDYILENAKKFYAPPGKSTGKSVGVVGSGPSGLTAAYFLRKAGNEVTVYDSKKEAGGMLMYAIPNYRLPKDLVRRYIKALEGMGIKFVLSTVLGKEVKPEDLEKKHNAVYYATGAWKRPVIGLSGEELTEFGLDFLIQVNQWMSGKVGSEVLVTGGGNVAMDVAITAKRLGAKKVTMACLESEKEMPASREEIARAREEGIIIMPSWGLEKVLSENGKVKGMRLKRCVSVFDENHRFKPVYDAGETTDIHAENILMAVGQQVDLSFLDEKYKIQLTPRGLINVEELSGKTSRPGVFAGGDVTSGPATVIKGISAGGKAAYGINDYLKAAAAPPYSAKEEGAFITFDPGFNDKKTGARLKELSPGERGIDKEDSFGLSADQALEEARRCMNCGCYAVNPSDIAPPLVALEAKITTTKRAVSAEDFFCKKLKVSEVLDPDELVKYIEVPIEKGAVMRYDKFRLRDAIDFAIVSVSTVYRVEEGKVKSARIVLGGAAPVPLRLKEAEDFLAGKAVTEKTASDAAALAIKGALPLEKNVYKITEVEELVKASILRLKG